MQLYDVIEKWAAKELVEPGQAELAASAIMALGIILTCFLANYIAKHFIVRAVEVFVRRTQTAWDDMILERHVFDRLSQLAPGMIIFVAAEPTFPQAPVLQQVIRRAAVVYMTVVTAAVVDSALNALNDIYETRTGARQRPIKSYIQVIKIIAYLITAVVVISTVLNRSPVVLLSGIGALSAVLMLVFKDSILGLVASIQLSTHDMVRPGDWIEVSKYGADGDVIDMSLTTVKVQNFDKTISTIPSYALISDSFKNWRGMTQAGGRRIKRAIFLDMQSVHFCSEEELDRYEGISLLREYVQSKRREVREHNEKAKLDVSEVVNGRRLTNLGTFRAYVVAFLRQHPQIHKNGMTLMVRQLAPGERGVGIELYCFTTTTVWTEYETIQADIFDHLLAITPHFGLRVFQQPGGGDVRALSLRVEERGAAGRDGGA